MRNKKHFQNLVDSIVVSCLLLVSMTMYILCIYYGVLNPKEGTDSLVTLVAGTLIFGGMTVSWFIIMVVCCFGYWTINEDEICLKKPFRKAVRIRFYNIVNVERKIVPFFLISNFQDEAYIISDETQKMVIMLNADNIFTLKFLEKYMNHDSQ